MVIFDFDGVIMDSMNEVALTTYNTITGESASTLEELPSGFLQLFLQNRLHVSRGAGNIPVLGIWCLHNASRLPLDYIMPLEEFQTLIAAAPGTVEDRAEHFFETRTRLFDRDREAWFRLNRPYQPLFSTLKSAQGRRLPILTNKNRQAVCHLFDYFGLKFNRETVYSGDGGTTKTQNIEKIRSAFPDEPLSLLDDALENLLELRSAPAASGVEMLLASWGYLGPGDIERADEAGLRVLSQEQAIRLFEAEN